MALCGVCEPLVAYIILISLGPINISFLKNLWKSPYSYIAACADTKSIGTMVIVSYTSSTRRRRPWTKCENIILDISGNFMNYSMYMYYILVTTCLHCTVKNWPETKQHITEYIVWLWLHIVVYKHNIMFSFIAIFVLSGYQKFYICF